MKTNELMIDDWVYCHQPECKGHRIDYIHDADEEVGADGEIYSIDDIDPIPLTPEILEKNGFEKQQGYIGSVFAFDDDDKDAHVIIHPKEDNYTRGAYTYIHVDHGCLSLDELPIEYIHELQHALKLCKIEKEIVV